MERYKNNISYYANSIEDWRKWLKDNHAKEKCVWLILYNKQSGVPSLTWSEAVDQALCFGWIDSVANKRDAESRYQYFCPRKPKSNWSKINKDKVERLLATNQIAPAGMAMIELAKKTGTWDALNQVDELQIPKEMEQYFKNEKLAKDNWEAFPPSTKKGILEWILNAKQDVTKQKRILETVTLAKENIRANQYKPK